MIFEYVIRQRPAWSNDRQKPKIHNMNTELLFLSGLGFQEILLIGVLVLVLFGAKKVPEFMKGLGKGFREFKEGVKDIKSDSSDLDQPGSENRK